MRPADKRLAVLGASLFQAPLIRRAQELGCFVYVFAAPCGDVGERLADVFYPISTADRDAVLEVCRDERVDGVVTIGSDFNNVVATWVANELGLPANTKECAYLSSNKQAMREAFANAGDPSPRSFAVAKGAPLPAELRLVSYPLIVKPSDRSGSRGITKVGDSNKLRQALSLAWDESFNGVSVVEEFLEGDEFSVESLSWEGKHCILQVTRKYTTGSPHFIETAHVQPPMLDEETRMRIEHVVSHALDTLKIKQGASHAEVKVNSKGQVGIVEIGSRMGGDLIGSDLVPLSTGIDYLGAVVDCALGVRPNLRPHETKCAAAVRFVLRQKDARALAVLNETHPELVVHGDWANPDDRDVTDSSRRFGYCVMASDNVADLIPWLPEDDI